MTLAPVVLFAYKRIQHLSQTVDALQKNLLAKESNLFIYSDGPKNKSEAPLIEEIRSYLKAIKGFKSVNVIKRSKNMGLANSIISGATEIFENHKKIIVLEDDIISSSYFLKFMNSALNFYGQEQKVFSVSGYNYPIQIPKNYKYSAYFAYRCSSWGWGTWKNRWEKSDWNVKDYQYFLLSPQNQKKFERGGEDLTDMLQYQMKNYIDSWAIRWCYAHYKNDAYCLYPVVSKIKNIGLDRSGTHRVKMKIDIKLDTSKPKFSFPKTITVNEEILSNFSLYFKRTIFRRLIHAAKKLIFPYVK